MVYLILFLILALNASPFILKRFDLWRAEGIAARFCLLLIFCYSIFAQKKYVEKNKELACLVFWIGFSTLLAFCSSIKGFPFTGYHLSQLFNVISFVVLYKAIVDYCTDAQIWRIFIWLRYSIIFTLLLCALQKLGLSQFFNLLVKDNPYINNLTTGILGNGTHLSGFLAMCSPLFFTKKREDILSLILLFILLFSSGQSIADPSISGFVILAVLLGVFTFRNCKKAFYWFIGIGMLALIVFLSIVDERVVSQFFCFNGRIEFWERYLPVIKKYFVTGIGLGTVFGISKVIEIPGHLHQEYIQILVELGVIGLVLVIWNIKSFFSIRAGGARFRYQLIFLGFLLSGLFNYPMHLWLPATYACIAYACVVALRREEC